MAAASLGRLTLDLAVRLGSFEQGMTQAERKTKQTTDGMGKAFTGFKSQVAEALGGTQLGSIIDGLNNKFGSLKGGVVVAGAALAGMAIGGAVVAFGALAKLAIETAKADAQLLILANRANTSVQSFQILEHASAGLGVTQDQLGSILADVQEKLGEFSASGGSGGAADFFEALKNNTKMTDDQIKSLGKTLQGKDGVQAIQIMKNEMDKIGATSQEQRFVFESLASDLGNLMPLFANGGVLLSEYGDALEDAGVLKTKESIEQSRVLAAQTQSVQTRFEGFKNQLAGQMMPVLSSLLGYFLDGATKGGQFGGVIQSVGVIARGVAAAIVGVAATIEVLIKLISNFVDQAANIGATAAKVLTTDTATERAIALWLGFNTALNGTKATVSDIGSTIKNAMDGALSVIDATAPKLDKLGQLYYQTGDAAQQSAKGIALDTKTAEENAKAKEKAANAAEKLNKQLQVNAKVQANAAKYNFAGIEGKNSLPSGLLSAINMQESKGNANALGPMTKFGKAKGGFQFLDGTAKRFGLVGSSVFDTGKAAEAAAKYLKILYDQFGSWEKAISAYHAGEGNVKNGTGLGPINRQYVKNVLEYMDSALKGVGTTANDAIRYVDEAYKAQQSIILKYLNDQEKIEFEHAVSIQEIKEAFAENDPSREKYLKLQQVVYQKDVEEFKKAQQQKQYDAINSYMGIQEQIRSLSNGADNIFAQATMSPDDYGRWSLENDRSNAQVDLKKQRVGVEQSIMTSDAYSTDDDRYEALLDAHKEYRAGMAAIDVDYQQQSKDLEQSQHDEKLNMYGSLLSQAGAVWGSMTQMIKDSAGEGSAAYKTMFFAQQAIAIGQAIISTELAATKALELGPVLGIPASTLVRGMGYASVGLIAAQTISGMAHDGIDNIPKEGTWLLDKGERVVDSRTNGDLKDMIANQKSGGGDVHISVQVTDSGVSTQSNQSDQKQLGQMIGNAVRTVIRQEQRQGGLLSR